MCGQIAPCLTSKIGPQVSPIPLGRLQIRAYWRTAAASGTKRSAARQLTSFAQGQKVTLAFVLFQHRAFCDFFISIPNGFEISNSISIPFQSFQKFLNSISKVVGVFWNSVSKLQIGQGSVYLAHGRKFRCYKLGIDVFSGTKL